MLVNYISKSRFLSCSEHGKRGVHYLHKPGALFSTAAASNPATKIKTTELSLPSLNVANLERSGCINKVGCQSIFLTSHGADEWFEKIELPHTALDMRVKGV